MKEMTVIQKISYSALFIALGMILSRLLSLPYLFGLPFLKVGLTPSVVMFSSLYLGPVWGFIVGTFTDVFGAVMFPQGGEFNPLFTIAASLTGLIPYFMYRLFSNRIEKRFPISLLVILIGLSTFLTIYFWTNDFIYSESGKKSYEITNWLRYVITFGSFGLTILFLFVVFFIKKHFKNKKINSYYDIYTIGTAIFATYFFFKIPVSSLVKSFVLSYDFTLVFIVQAVVGFLACFVHIVLVSLALNVSTFFPTKGVLIKEIKPNKVIYNLETLTKEKIKDEKEVNKDEKK